jgi:hypothetical protein
MLSISTLFSRDLSMRRTFDTLVELALHFYRPHFHLRYSGFHPTNRRHLWRNLLEHLRVLTSSRTCHSRHSLCLRCLLRVSGPLD